MLMLFIVLFSAVTTFANFQAVFPLISPKVLILEYSHQISPQKSEIYHKIFITKLLVPKS